MKTTGREEMKMKTLCVAINREEEIMKNWVRSRITTGC
jgi:hypothetical protein